MDFEKDSSALEPDFIVQDDRVIYMPAAERARRVVVGLVPLFEYFLAQFRGGTL